MFKVEDNIPIPKMPGGVGKQRTREALADVLSSLQNGQSVFVAGDEYSYGSILKIIQPLKTQSKTFVMRAQKEPVKGVRIWAKTIQS